MAVRRDASRKNAQSVLGSVIEKRVVDSSDFSRASVGQSLEYVRSKGSERIPFLQGDAY